MSLLSKLGFPSLFGVTLGLGLGFVSQTGSIAPAFHPERVQCYAATSANPQHAPASPHEDEREQAGALAALRGALEAARQCSPGRCGKAAGRQLETTLADYLEKRTVLTSRLLAGQSQVGLELATQLFATPEQTELTHRLALLHGAGGLDMASYGAGKYALALTVLKPVAAFRPCEDARRTIIVRGYVY